MSERIYCGCAETRLVFVACMGGSKQFRRQCVRCGSYGNNLPHSSLTLAERANAPELDNALREEWAEKQRAARVKSELEKLTEKPGWWDRYQAYLQTPEWQSKRALRRQVDRGDCQARLRGCEVKGYECHHLSYAHLGDEALWELRTVCGSCHHKITLADRGQLDLLDGVL